MKSFVVKSYITALDQLPGLLRDDVLEPKATEDEVVVRDGFFDAGVKFRFDTLSSLLSSGRRACSRLEFLVSHYASTALWTG